ncbi:MAG: tyrosine-type recombinase/integrase, partial [Gaiellaceae bacterium]
SAVESFLSGYFSTCRRSLKTEAAYRTDLAQFQTYLGARESIELIGVELLEKWASELATRGYAPVSIRRKFASLRVFFGYWVRKGDLASSPLWRIRLDLAQERRLPRSLTAADTKRLLEQAWARVVPPPPGDHLPSDRAFLALRDLAIVEVLFATGMRVGELVALGLFDWDEGEASFLVNGKGSRQRLAILPDQRSVTALRSYLTPRAAMQLGHSALLVSASGKRLSAQGVARMLAKLAEDAGVSVRVTPHMLRHTVATLLLRLGADIRIVQEVLGHSSIATTQRYTHVSKEHLRSTLRVHHPNYHLGIETQGRLPGTAPVATVAGRIPPRSEPARDATSADLRRAADLLG